MTGIIRNEVLHKATYTHTVTVQARSTERLKVQTLTTSSSGRRRQQRRRRRYIGLRRARLRRCSRWLLRRSAALSSHALQLHFLRALRHQPRTRVSPWVPGVEFPRGPPASTPGLHIVQPQACEQAQRCAGQDWKPARVLSPIITGPLCAWQGSPYSRRVPRPLCRQQRPGGAVSTVMASICPSFLLIIVAAQRMRAHGERGGAAARSPPAQQRLEELPVQRLPAGLQVKLSNSCTSTTDTPFASLCRRFEGLPKGVFRGLPVESRQRGVQTYLGLKLHKHLFNDRRRALHPQAAATEQAQYGHYCPEKSTGARRLELQVGRHCNAVPESLGPLTCCGHYTC